MTRAAPKPELLPRLHVGTYTRNGGAGLHPLTGSGPTGWTPGPAFSGAPNASFGTSSARHGLLYLVDEQSDGAIQVFRARGAQWEQVARLPTQGEYPCYIALDPAERCVAVANYGRGSIAVYGLDPAGVPMAPPDVYEHEGGGPVEDRQDGPHAHCVCFSRDQDWLYHVDLGADEVLAHRYDPASGMLAETHLAFRAPAGTGPRHLALHPVLPLALLLGELASSLTLLDVADGALSARQTVSTLPPDFTGESLGGHLSVNAAGDRVYVTNRGHDSIAVFAWDNSGTLTLLQHVPGGGASPRAFVLLESERQLLLANEEDGSLTVFDLRDDGTLSATDARIKVPGAAFILVADGLPAARASAIGTACAQGGTAQAVPGDRA